MAHFLTTWHVVIFTILTSSSCGQLRLLTSVQFAVSDCRRMKDRVTPKQLYRLGLVKMYLKTIPTREELAQGQMKLATAGICVREQR
jgi:hypothetical protein